MLIETEIEDIANSMEWSNSDEAERSRKQIKRLPKNRTFKASGYTWIRIKLKSLEIKGDERHIHGSSEEVSGHFIIADDESCILVQAVKWRYNEVIIPWENILYIDI